VKLKILVSVEKIFKLKYHISEYTGLLKLISAIKLNHYW